jgi:anti-sigma-K factor RskA
VTGCEHVRAVAAELALDVLTGEERAEAVAHLSGCASCRDDVAAASLVADGMLHLAPAAAPAPTLEAAVLDRIAGERSVSVVPPRRWPAWAPAAVAAAVAAVVALAGMLVAARGDDVRTAELVAADGESTGQLVIFDDDRMVCVFDDTREGATWTVEVVVGDEVIDVGGFEAPGGEWSWMVRLPVDGDEVDRVVMRART